jgi:hypothetical protein
VSKASDGRKLKWSIEFDEPLRTLLDSAGIEDPGHQMMVCDALCRIGLAEHRLFGDDTDQLEVQENCYISTKTMRKLARSVNSKKRFAVFRQD